MLIRFKLIRQFTGVLEIAGGGVKYLIYLINNDNLHNVLANPLSKPIDFYFGLPCSIGDEIYTSYLLQNTAGLLDVSLGERVSHACPQYV